MKKIVRLTETDLIKLVKRVINENRKRTDEYEGTLSLWKGDWVVSYTTENGDLRGDYGLKLHPTQVEDINNFKDYINKRNGVDVNFTINDGYAKLDDINVTHYKIVKDRKATEYGWKQTYFIIDDFDIENYVLIPFNKFNEWEKTNLNKKNLNKKRGFNKYEEIVSKTEVV